MAPRNAKQRKQKQTGFSLIELLLAIALFAVISLLSYHALSSLLQLEQALNQHDRQWQSVMLLFDTFEQDVRSAVPRSMRISIGQSQQAWLAKTSLSERNDAQLQFCRMPPIARGASFSTVANASIIRRVGYRFSLGKIERLTWPLLDGISQAGTMLPERLALLENVRRMQLRYLSANPAQWHDRWPLPQQDEILPRAVELRVTLDSGQIVHRLVSLE